MSEWIFICNPNMYNVIGAFKVKKNINWKQNANTNVKAGDTVYIYIGQPYQEIKYETIAVKVNLPKSTIDDSDFIIEGTNYINHGRYMELELVRTFNTGLLPFTELDQNGLSIVQWPTKVTEELAKYISEKKDQLQPKERQFFFVFQNKSYKEEKQGEYLWAPKRDRKGHKVAHWERIADVKKGDLIIHSVGRQICAISVAQNDSGTETRPKELPSNWTDVGWMVDTKYYEIERPLQVSDHIDQLLKLQPKKHGPFNIKGGGKQGYLFSANKSIAEYIIEELIKKQESQYSKEILQELRDYTINFENQLDQDLVDGVDDLINAYVDEKVPYQAQPQPKPEPKFNTKGMSYTRDKQTAIKALTRANFKCEIDNTHPSFIRKRANVEYTEPHHLIPMAKQDKFDYSLDVLANIVSLCSNCHNQIHYGIDSEKMIKELHLQRENDLSKAGIFVELDNLKTFY